MDSQDRQLQLGKVAEWFPLLPRSRPPCSALPHRIDENRELAHKAAHGAKIARIPSAAEAHNKAALILSDCGLADLAQQLCWRQFDVFYSARPLTTKAAKFALQPIVNLGRLLIRGGHGTRAYQLFQSTFDAMRTEAATTIDGRHIHVSDLVDQASQRRELRRFLWTVLLADGTRALTRTGQWGEALNHIDRHKGIGKRMLDGRQVAILARCTADNIDGAIEMLNDSATAEPWEETVIASLRTLCLSIGHRPTGASAAAMVNYYLGLDLAPGHSVFHTRLGLFVLDLTRDRGEAREVAAKIVRETTTSADAYAARDVLSHVSPHLRLTDADRNTLTEVVGASGLHRGTMPAELLDDLMTSVSIGEAEVARLLQ